MNKLITILALITIFSCQKEKQEADLIVTNTNIYTVDDNFNKAEAFAVIDGKIVGVGSQKDIENNYEKKPFYIHKYLFRKRLSNNQNRILKRGWPG